MNTTIENTILSATINAKGAELISLKDNNGKELIWQGNPAFWGKHSPVLFPIVGTLKNDTYIYNGKSYNLSRHGFARDINFKLITQQRNKVVFSLQSDNQTIKNYPFNFELQINYTLNQNKITITYTIINNSDVTMPFSIGAHPAFALTNEFENYSLQFEHAEKLQRYPLQNDLITSKSIPVPMKKNQLPLDYSLFENDALIFKSLSSKRITLLENNHPILHFSFQDFPNFGIWTKNKAPFICLEPWLGYSDTIDTNGNILIKEGIQLLEPKKRFDCSFSIEIA